MRKLLTLVTLLSTPAIAATPYISVHGGLIVPDQPTLPMRTNTLHVGVDDGYAVGGALGLDFGAIRVEVEGQHSRASVSGIHDAKRSFAYSDSALKRDAVMANAYVDIRMSRSVTGYVGGGVGYAHMTMRAKGAANCEEVIALRIVNGPLTGRTGPSGSCQDQGHSGNWGLSYQGMAGFDFTRGNGWSIGPQVRYVVTSGIRTAGASKPTRETRFTSDRTYRGIEALLTVRKSF